MSSVPKDQRITRPYMTRYEYTRIIGMRGKQISQGAPIQVDVDGETDPNDIARKELEQHKIDYIIKRELPDGSFEEWSIPELEIDYEAIQ